MWVAVTIWSSAQAWPPKHEMAFQECSVPRVVRDQHPSVMSNLELGRDRSLSTTRVHHNVQACPAGQTRCIHREPFHSFPLSRSISSRNQREKENTSPTTHYSTRTKKQQLLTERRWFLYSNSMSLEGHSFPPSRFCHFPSIKISKVSYNL